MNWEDLAIETLAQLIEFVKNSGPILWEITRQKIIVSAVVDLVWVIPALLLFIILLVAGIKVFKLGVTEREEDKQVAGTILFVLCIVAGIFVLGGIGNIIPKLFSTDYLILKELLSLVK